MTFKNSGSEAETERVFPQLRRLAAVGLVLALVSTALSVTMSPAGAIVGGNETTIDQHPWQVSVQEIFGNGPSNWGHFCGGSILSSTAVLTAAHCTEGLAASDVGVRVGVTTITNPNEGQAMTVMTIRDNPRYAIDELGDLSVLILSQPIVFNANVQPIQLASTSELASAQTAVVTGWGDIGETTPGGWPVLKEASVPMVNDATCVNQLPISPPHEECAGGTGNDSCYADSGGPLLIRNGNLEPRLGGVVSWGEECGGATPGVYAEVPGFDAWIRENANLSQAPSATCNGLTATIVGTDGPDVLRGTPGRDVIAGLGGNDRIYGFDGADVICGGSGRDKIWGGRQSDTIFGEADGDKIWGNAGSDMVFGNEGNDRLVGSAGNDELDGGRGRRDVLDGRSGTDGCVDAQATTIRIACE